MFPFNNNLVPTGMSQSPFGMSNIQYVNNRQSAENYQTQPNQTIILMDSNEDVFYLVKSDASNMKTIEEYEFHKRETKKIEYVTTDEFNELKGLMESYKPLLDSLKE